MERTDDLDILEARDVCRFLGIDDRTLRRWVEDKYFPKATTFGRRKGWRRGHLRKWMEATEFLQGLGLRSLLPSDGGDDETVADDDDGHSRTPTGHSRTNGQVGGKATVTTANDR